VHLTMAIAQAIMRRHCPSCVVEGLELRHGGNISTVYEVHCTKPDQSVIIKIYPDTFHWKMGKERSATSGRQNSLRCWNPVARPVP
jgi:hypothetical protein